MQVKHYRDQAGVGFMEYISSQLHRLKEMQAEYEKKGMPAWILKYDEDNWILTIKETK